MKPLKSEPVSRLAWTIAFMIIFSPLLALTTVEDREEEGMTFLIGQRVIVGDEIGIVQRGRTNGVQISEYKEGYVWVYLPSKEHALQFSELNVKPLPNGQL